MCIKYICIIYYYVSYSLNHICFNTSRVDSAILANIFETDRRDNLILSGNDTTVVIYLIINWKISALNENEIKMV